MRLIRERTTLVNYVQTRLFVLDAWGARTGYSFRAHRHAFAWHNLFRETFSFGN